MTLDTPVREIMTPGVVTVAEDASLPQVYRALVAHSVHAVLVIGREERRPLGWVTSRGLLSGVTRDEARSVARDAISERPAIIEPSATAREAAFALTQPGVSHLLVAHGPDRAPEGVVSDLDIVELMAGERPRT